MTSEVHADRSLQIEVFESLLQLIVSFAGRSEAREPALFIDPILKRAAEKASSQAKLMVIDFRRLDRMNSSSVPPVLRILELARRGQLRLKLIYARDLKWQTLSFAALKAFATPDGRVAIVGA